ncbi:HlyD family type I secretion periplasmic adaptor subunit [Martelella alba]|uniref:Membrane fusion protein (MFP) family protein n=2 Tax=Martelella alba TaxID=2590451 RepID=A0A506U6S3_9HYPH|nr:HlyD family type I secretion periplasmic adaptor subunit [Martelella alba]
MSDKWSCKHFLRTGYAALALGIGGMVLWGFATEIDGAVVASGQVEVQVRKQVIQHQDGGVIAEIDVHDGEPVKAGQTLIRLDDTTLAGQRQILQQQIFEAKAKLDRASTQALGETKLVFRPDLIAEAAGSPELNAVLAAERRLFDVQTESTELMKQQLERQEDQARDMIAASRDEIAALQTSREINEAELARYTSLLDRGLTQTSTVSGLRQQTASLDAQIADLQTDIAETNGNLASYAVQLLRVQSDMRKDAETEYTETQPELAELIQKRTVVDAEYDRLSLRAPMDGTVYDMSVFTVGGVIKPGEEIAAIAPANKPFILALHVSPSEIDRVRTGQEAIVKFPNFNSRKTPEFHGQVRTISADSLTDQRSGAYYYRVEVNLDETSLQQAKDRGIITGMPVEAFLQTDERSPVSYLVKPLTDYFDMAFRED